MPNEWDAQKLWQHLNHYAQGGHLLEVRKNVLSEDGTEKTPEDTFWPMDKEGNHIGGWWAKKEEVDLLVREGLVEPGQWRDSLTTDGAIRKYRITDLGKSLAASGESAVLSHFAERKIQEEQA